MSILGAIGRRFILKRGSWWHKTALLGPATVVVFLLVACSGGVEEQVDEAASSPAKDALKLELVLFENANHARGETLSLSQFRGQPVVINFWFPSCPPCVAEMPDLEASFQKHRGEGLEFIGIQLVGLDTAADGQAFVEKIGVTYALGPDETGDIIKDFRITGFPSTVFLDKDHNIVDKWTGLLTAEKIEELVQEVLN